MTEIYKAGGAHGIAALSLGTKTIAPVDKVFGPGNSYVVEAKRQMVGAVSIDLLPGPSEVLVAADATGNPRLFYDRGSVATYGLALGPGPEQVCPTRLRWLRSYRDTSRYNRESCTRK